MIWYRGSCLLITVLLLFVNHRASQGKTDLPRLAVLCDEQNDTIFELPAVPEPVSLRVDGIYYDKHLLKASDPDNCLPRLFLKFYNLSIYPFQFYSMYSAGETWNNITFFDCSSTWPRQLRYNFDKTYSYGQYFSQLDSNACPIFALSSEQSLVELDLLSCAEMFRVASPVSAYDLQSGLLYFSWKKLPDYGFKYVDCKHKPTKSGPQDYQIYSASAGSFALVLVVVALLQIYRNSRMRGEDQARVEKFLEDYRALKPTRFSYADIKRITNCFKEKLGEGAHGAVFKGKLSNDILVAVKVLINNSDEDGKEFINEVGTMGKIHHVNVVRLLGFCADGFHRALIYNFFPNGSLQKFIYPPDNDSFLGWEKLQQIALGIAKGIEYLHEGCDHQILHFDINPHNVLLDDNFVPKISDFGLAKLCAKNQSVVSVTTTKGTLGYIAPEVFSRNFGNVSCKSDVYSFGMLLLEMVGGKKNVETSAQETTQVLYPDWIHDLVEGRETHIQIDEGGDMITARKLAIVGLWCIQWHPVNRPAMKTAIQMLEDEVDNLKNPPNPFDSSTSSRTRAITPVKHLKLELEVIHESD